MDISDFPALIAAFTFGPISGVIVELIKNAFGLFSTVTGGVGELANFLIGTSMAICSGTIYQYKKSRKGAILSLSVGTIVMMAIGAVVNYFILLPLYSTFMPMDTLIQSFSAFIPFIRTRFDIVLYSTIPFNLVKGLLISIIMFVVYKKLSPILKGTKS
jgi:riboflavin transporter FmnP